MGLSDELRKLPAKRETERNDDTGAEVEVADVQRTLDAVDGALKTLKMYREAQRRFRGLHDDIRSL